MAVYPLRHDLTGNVSGVCPECGGVITMTWPGVIAKVLTLFGTLPLTAGLVGILAAFTTGVARGFLGSSVVVAVGGAAMIGAAIALDRWDLARKREPAAGFPVEPADRLGPRADR